jgi:hypothetical protein
MNKPIKPKKPSKYEPVPSTEKLFTKILVFDNANKQYLLIDEKSHPRIFVDDEGNDICQGYLNYDELERLNYEHDFSSLKFSALQVIFNILQKDFTVEECVDRDGYSMYTEIWYTDSNPNYKKELEIYNNRFLKYEEDLKKYNQDLENYNKFKTEEKRKKLEQELKKISNK